MNLNEARAIVIDELNMVLPRYIDRLHATVDPRKVWTGSIDTAKVVDSTFTDYNNNKYYTCNFLQKMTFGAFAFSLSTGWDATTKAPKLNKLEFSYQIPAIGRYDQPLYKNTISRGTWDCGTFESELKLRKFVASKIKSLVERIEVWHKDSTHTNLALFLSNNAANPPHMYYNNAERHGYGRHLLDTIAVLRLVSNIHHARAATYNVNGTDRIVQLVDLVSDEIMVHIRNNPSLDNLTLREH